METDQLVQLGRARLTHNYSQQPLVLTRGEGCYVWDNDGKRYLDLFAGIAVSALGHCHPQLTTALVKQVRRFLHVSNIYFTEPQIQLAERLTELTFADRVFFCNSGAEANEAAIKVTRRYMREVRKQERFEIITFTNSFHGRTMATVTATAQEKYHKGFEPMLPGFRYATLNDLASVEAQLTEQTAAIMLEPIQAEGGIHVVSQEFMRQLREFCDEHGLLLILDEVQTGIGRTGTLYAYEQYDVQPDIVTSAKALGAGVPIGAMLTTQEISQGLAPGTHATTFGGNPLACAAALATLEIIERERLLENCVSAGKYLKSQLKALVQSSDLAVEVRGEGLLLGLELNLSGKAVVDACAQRGVLLNAIGDKVLRFTPALIIQKGQLRAGLQVLTEVLGELGAS